MTSDLLPEFSFRHSAHDRLSDRRGDASFLETAWDDASTRVVLIRDQDLAVSDDGVHVATLSPAQAPPGQRMLLGAADGVVHFLVVESTPMTTRRATMTRRPARCSARCGRSPRR